MEKYEFRAEKPYAPIRVERVNVSAAKKLLTAYAGKESEMTSVHNYAYYRAIFCCTQRELSAIFSELASVENDHFNILARLLYLLGYDPKLRVIHEGEPQFWNGSFLQYRKEPCAVLKELIEEEKGAQRGYLKLSEEIPDRFVCAVLRRLAEDEACHVDLLEKQLKKRLAMKK